MAAVGFAVGLGNIWRFPYMTGENGGGAFVFVYLVCALVIGVPILIAELLIGRSGRGSPPVAFSRIAEQQAASKNWRWVGHLNLMTAFAISVVYAVVAGWVLRYLQVSITEGFAGADSVSAGAAFDALLLRPGELLFWSAVVALLTGSVLFFGVQKGIERSVRVLMPLLFLLLASLAVYNVFAGGFAEALSYLFSPDFSKLTPQTFLAAVSQAFFSIGVAMAGMMTFGAYLPAATSIPRSVVLIVFADTAVALLAGLVIFPMVFQHGLDPADGAGLIFKTLPAAFAQMPGVVPLLFFLLLSVAAVTSMVGLVEPVVAYFNGARGWSRQRAVAVVTVALAVFSFVSVLSFNVWADVSVVGIPLADFLDLVPNQIMLPVGGLLITLFVGWVVSRELAAQEVALPATLQRVWHGSLKLVLPLVVAVILITGLAS